MTQFKQGDWVYAWNFKTPDKKVKTRFLHTMDGINRSNICVNPLTIDWYPKQINTIRYDMIASAKDWIPNTPKAETYAKSEQPIDTQNYIGHIWLLFILLIGTWIYMGFNSPRTDITDSLFERVHDTEMKTSELSIKVRDDSDQLSELVEDYYSGEYEQAREIANENGYVRYYHFVWVRDGKIVRLSDSFDSEIEINIYSKVITRFE